jgi:hypothetical protein
MDECEIEGHTDPDGRKDETEDDGVTGDAARLPGSGTELLNQLNVTGSGDDVDEDAESDECDSRPLREAGVVSGDMGLDGSELTEEQSETADGEADAHEAKAGANPGEEGPLGGEVDSGILFSGLFHAGIV